MRIVIKVGTSTLAHSTGNINIRHVEELCKVMSDLKNAGHEIILVSSGAIGMGVGKLSLKEKPQDMPTKQAAAAVGQCELMFLYDKFFGEFGNITGQLLVTKGDFENEERHTNLHNSFMKLFEYGAKIVDKPAPGDIAFFDWDGDGRPIEHVGIVTKVDDNGWVTTIEGNKSDMVGYRQFNNLMVVFVRPNWEGVAVQATETPITPTKDYYASLTWDEKNEIKTFPLLRAGSVGIYVKILQDFLVIPLKQILMFHFL